MKLNLIFKMDLILPDRLQNIIFHLLDAEHRLKYYLIEIPIYRVIKQYPAFRDQEIITQAMKGLINKKLKSWLHIEIDDQLLEDLIALLSESMRAEEFIQKYSQTILQMELNPKLLSDQEGLAGLFLYLLQHSDQLSDQLSLNKELASCLSTFSVIYICTKSKLKDWLPSLDVILSDESNATFAHISPSVLETVTKHLNKHNVGSFQELRSIYHRIQETCTEDGAFNSAFYNALEKYLIHLYYSSVKIDRYRICLNSELRTLLNKRIVGNGLPMADFPLLGLIDSINEPFLQRNRDKLIKVLQYEREQICKKDCEYDQYDYNHDQIASQYQECINKLFGQLLQSNSACEEISNIFETDGEELILDKVIDQHQLVRCAEIDQSKLPHNQKFSCYVTSLLVCQLSDPLSPISRILNVEIGRNFFPEKLTNDYLIWIGKAVKHCLIYLTLNMFYITPTPTDQEDQENQAEHVLPITNIMTNANTDTYIEILRYLHQLYYILNVRTTLDISGQRMENFICDQHQESVVYDFIMSLFKNVAITKYCSIHTIVNDRIGFSKEHHTSSLIRLSICSPPSTDSTAADDSHNDNNNDNYNDIEHILNNSRNDPGDTIYFIDTEKTDYFGLLINSGVKLIINPIITIKNKLTDQEQKYRLVGIINQNDVHKYCKFLYNDRWYHFDDFAKNARRLVNITGFLSAVLDDVAILMYQKYQPQHQSDGLREPEIPIEFRLSEYLPVRMELTRNRALSI